MSRRHDYKRAAEMREPRLAILQVENFSAPRSALAPVAAQRRGRVRGLTVGKIFVVLFLAWVVWAGAKVWVAWPVIVEQARALQ